MKYTRLLLLPFSLFYGLVIVVRNWFFDIGILRITKTVVPVISVGNISAGGTGKTPFVEMLAEQLRDAHKKVAVISRGYKRKSTGYLLVSDGTLRYVEAWEAGDEASQMAEKLNDVVVAVDKSRVRAAKNVIGSFGVNAIIMDDGFQHRYLYRDLNIVLMAADEILKGGWLLPAGNRRETMSALKRADAVVVSRCADMSKFNQAQAKLKKYNKPVIGAWSQLKSMRQALTNQLLGLENIAKKKMVVFSGIGDPKSFEDMLKKTNAIIVKHLTFSDHHWYSENDIHTIIKARREAAADFIITTEKDMVRLKERFLKFIEAEPVYIAEIHQEIFSGKERLKELLGQVVH